MLPVVVRLRIHCLVTVVVCMVFGRRELAGSRLGLESVVPWPVWRRHEERGFLCLQLF
jgi:hypothetical protein